jgi:hypothetical protein
LGFYGGDKSTEYLFQNDLIKLLLDNGWLLGDPKKYNRVLASSFELRGLVFCLERTKQDLTLELSIFYRSGMTRVGREYGVMRPSFKVKIHHSVI